MAQRTSAIPDTAGKVRDQLLKFKPSGPSVDEARAAMLAAKEPATTFRQGVKVPRFIEEANRGQGGNTPVAVESVAPVTVRTPQNDIADEPVRNVEVRDARATRALKFNAQQKLKQAGYRNGEAVSVDQILAAGVTKEEAEALLGYPIETEATVEEIPEPAAAVIPPAEPSAPPVERVPVEAEETFTGDFFTGKIFRDGKSWVAEIVYKNGAGTERFTASSKNGLLSELTKAKAHATNKIRQEMANRKRILKGEFQKPDSWEDFWKVFYEKFDLTVEAYNALPEKTRLELIDKINEIGAIEFMQDYADEYYATLDNYESMCKYLDKERIPITKRNLEKAYFHLSEFGLLETKPEQVDVPAAAPAVAATPEVSAQPVATPVEDSTVAPTPAASPSAPASAPAAAPVRKRAVSGLIPGSSSASSGSTERSEDRNKPRELSEKELRTMPMSDLKRIATQGRKYGRY